MRTQILIIFLIACGLNGKAQNAFSKQFQSISGFTGLANSYDSGYVVCGEYGFMKIDKSGNFVWGKACTILNSRICRTNDSSYVVVGSSLSTHEIICIKFNEQGDTIWTSTISALNNLYVSKVIQSEDSTILFIGNESSAIAPYIIRMFMAKLAPDGTFLWMKNYSGANNENILTGIQEGPDHNYYVCGGLVFYSGTYSIKGVLMKITPSGNVQWNRVFYDSSFNHSSLSDICTLHSGLLCSLSENNVGVIMKTDWDGNLLWAIQNNVMNGGLMENFIPGFRKKNENDFYFSCNESSLYEFDSTGQGLSVYNTLNGINISDFICSFSNGIAHIAQGFSGTCIVSDDSLYSSTCLVAAGNYISIPTMLTADSITFAVDSDGVQNNIPISLPNFTTSGMDNCPDFEGVQENSSLDNIKIYPNPSSEEISIDFTHYAIPNLITIFDLNGRLLVTFKPNKSFEQISLSNEFQPGVYTCCFQYADARITKRLVITK